MKQNNILLFIVEISKIIFGIFVLSFLLYFMGEVFTYGFGLEY